MMACVDERLDDLRKSAKQIPAEMNTSKGSKYMAFVQLKNY